MITQKRLKELLHYNADTGLFVWAKNRDGCHKGSEAGSKKDGYIKIQLDGKIYGAHRLAWLYMTGSFPNNHIDHINRIRKDNHFANLRNATSIENGKNRSIQCNNISGVTGVHWNNAERKWYSRIKINGKYKHLGRFDCLIEATKSRESALKEYGFSEGHGT